LVKDNDNISLEITVISVDKLKKDLKSTKKPLTTVNTQLTLLKEADSDISDSEGDEEASHLHMEEALQFAQFDKGFQPGITKIFKHVDHCSISRIVAIRNCCFLLDYFKEVR
jgi:hypothetical protein